MRIIDFDFLESLNPRDYRKTHPFPWLNPEGALLDDGFHALRETLPDVTLFDGSFNRERKFGQKSHDRYTLEYHRELSVPAPWQAFIAELEGPRYRKWLGRMLGTRFFLLSYHWHYTPNGCSVSPHCDSSRKLGSHIFYFNTEDDWDVDWGGQTVVLDDGGRLDCSSSPSFDDFLATTSSEALGNRSLLFSRTPRSWHGVKEIHCPENRLRKVFIVVINNNSPYQRVRRWLKKKPVPGY